MKNQKKKIKTEDFIMEKIQNVICPNCGKISEKKYNDFIDGYIRGQVKEIRKFIEDVQIDGIEYCAVCR